MFSLHLKCVGANKKKQKLFFKIFLKIKFSENQFTLVEANDQIFFKKIEKYKYLMYVKCIFNENQL
jgi:hypothetical protein